MIAAVYKHINILENLLNLRAVIGEMGWHGPWQSRLTSAVSRLPLQLQDYR
jgi:hypothetical protein